MEEEIAYSHIILVFLGNFILSVCPTRCLFNFFFIKSAEEHDDGLMTLFVKSYLMTSQAVCAVACVQKLYTRIKLNEGIKGRIRSNSSCTHMSRGRCNTNRVTTGLNAGGLARTSISNK